MIDIHSHLLPGIDDGPESFDEAVEMCRMAARDGTSLLLATPHQRHPEWLNDDLLHLERLRVRLQGRVGPHPRVLAGAEIRVDAELLETLEQAAATVLPLAGSNYLLLEFDFHNLTVDPVATVHEVMLAGYRPVIAHPECLPWLGPDLATLERLVERGATVQITSSSVLGDFGRGPQDASKRLLDRDMVHFVASDCHSTSWRPPGLSQAHELIARHWGTDLADLLILTNPRALIEDRPVEAAA